MAGSPTLLPTPFRPKSWLTSESSQGSSRSLSSAIEVRSLLMCHDFYVTGAALESRMGLEGQFTYCNEKRPFACYAGSAKRPLARAVNDKVTSCLIYSLVFASWFYVG